MPRQPHNRTTSSRPSRTRTRASSAERHQKVSGEVATTTRTVAEAEQQGRLRRVRSFTTRSGTVVNRGDSFKVRGTRGDNDAERTSWRHHPLRVVDDWALPRSHSAASMSRHVVASDDDDLTDTVVMGGDDMISADTTYTVMVLGSEGVGKTTVIQQLLTSEYLANKNYNVG